MISMISFSNLNDSYVALSSSVVYDLDLKYDIPKIYGFLQSHLSGMDQRWGNYLYLNLLTL